MTHRSLVPLRTPANLCGQPDLGPPRRHEARVRRRVRGGFLGLRPSDRLDPERQREEQHPVRQALRRSEVPAGAGRVPPAERLGGEI